MSGEYGSIQLEDFFSIVVKRIVNTLIDSGRVCSIEYALFLLEGWVLNLMLKGFVGEY